MSHPIFLLFNVTPIIAAWKELTPESLCTPQYSEHGGAPVHLLCSVEFAVFDERRPILKKAPVRTVDALNDSCHLNALSDITNRRVCVHLRGYMWTSP